MKNFTNNFKLFTSRLSARWLIMALMLLAGTSSAWASTIYFINSLSWTDIKIYYWGNVSVNWGDSPSMTKESYQINGSDVYKYTFNTDPQNVIFRGNNGNDVQTVDIAFSAGEQWTPNNQWDNRKAKGSWSTYTPPCTKSVSNGTGNYSNGEITLSATYNTCGDAYIGFQWKKQGDEWCYTNDGTEKCYKALDLQNKSNEVVETSFTTLYGQTLSGTYVFRPYIVDGSDATNWIYGDEFEVITCSDPSAGYSISNENASVDWDGTEKEVIITTANGYATPSKIYYDGNETKPTAAGEYTITIDVPLNGTYCAATDLEIGTYTITCPTVAAPAITTSATICAGTQVTLSNYNGVNDNTVKWYSDEECNSEVTEQVTLTDNGTIYNANYYAKAYHEASGCYSSEYSTLTFEVNPLPTINIGDNTNAVKFEDVVLTATGNNIDDVTWTADKGTITKDATDPTKAVLTYDQTGTVTVTATATSEDDCTSVEATKTVTFGAENCNSTTTTEQQTVGKIKVMCKKPSWIGGSEKFYCYAWVNNTSTTLLGGWPGTELTQKDGDYYYVVVEANNKDIKIILNDNSEQTVDSDVLYANNVYKISATSTKSGDKYTFTNNTFTSQGTYTEPVEVTVDPEISAPAAKTISVSTTEGEGNIIFSGQVVKTGCADALTYGFAYSTDANADKNNWTKVDCANTGNTAGTQYNGEKTGIEVDGTYYVCAYITNSAGTSYGAVTEITVSTKKTLITSVTLTHVKDANGTKYEPSELANLIYCVGDEVWFELNYEGSKFVGFKWTTYPGNDLLGAYNGNKYKFTITGEGSIGISLRNEANVDGEGNPTWVESNLLKFKTHPEPTAPYISINPASGVLCEGNTATITVTNPSTDCAYKLVDESLEAEFVEYESGDLKYSVGSVGKYYVAAKHIDCPTNEYTSNQVEINQIISTSASISIDPANPETTPWEPVTITVNPQEGYVYELSYTGNNLAGVDGVIIKQNGDSYTYYIPRPDSWGTGDSNPVRTAVEYGIKAQLKVDGEASECELNDATVIIQLKDEDNEDCE